MEEMLEATVEGEKKWGTLSWSVLFVSFFFAGLDRLGRTRGVMEAERSCSSRSQWHRHGPDRGWRALILSLRRGNFSVGAWAAVLQDDYRCWWWCCCCRCCCCCLGLVLGVGF